MIVIAFDPGETTGYAAAEVDFSGSGVPTFNLLEATEIKTYYELDAVFTRKIDLFGDVVIVEAFNLFPTKAKAQIGSTFPAAEMIGTIRYIMHMHHCEGQLVMQTPHQKERITDQMLRDHIMAHLHSSPHVRDALRHIVFYALEKRYGTKP